MRILLLLFFFLSGAGGLIYEVVWTKLLTLVIGSTVYSLSTVLVAFMGGLALGSYLGGRFIDKRGNPLLIYAILEGLIGLYCLLIPTLISLTDPLFAVFYNKFYSNQFYLFSLLRFVVCAGVLIFPTTLMGATLPVLSKYFVSNRDKLGASVGRLYAINTLGAVVGSFGSGFVLLRMLGQWRTIVIAASANLLICAIILIYWLVKIRNRPEAISDKSPERAHPVDESREVSPEFSRMVWAVLLAYAANGFAGMTYQIAWTRALSLSLGSSTYAFSLILTTFIMGLALGSAVGARIVDRLKRPDLVFGWVELAIGFVALSVMWGLGRFPTWVVPLFAGYGANFNSLLTLQFAMVFIMILAPTFLMGTAFPLAVKVVSMGRAGIGAPVGIAYGWNTGGAIAGSFLCGFVLIPLLGLQKTIGAANMVNWLAGILLLGVGWKMLNPREMMRRWAAVCVLFGLAVLSTAFMPPWNSKLMDSGPFLYANEYRKIAIEGNKTYWEKMGQQLFYEEGVTTTVSVRKEGSGLIFLRINGKTDASTGGDMSTQVLSGHLPLIFQKAPRDVLVIGLASGMSAGSVMRYPTIERLDVLEISEGVVKACKKYFSKYNYDVLSDPRVNLIIGDGRNHLRETNRLYDVIISEPSNPWIAGISSLFTREYFQSGRDHLKPGGGMLIWLQAYSMDPVNLKSIIRTFSEVFPEMTLWEMGVRTAGDLGLLGFVPKQGGLPSDTLDCAAAHQHFQEPQVAKDLKRIAIDSVPRLLSGILLTQAECARFGRDSRVHTDDLLFLEYEAPRSIYRSTEGDNLKIILSAGKDPLLAVNPGCLDVQGRITASRLIRARRMFLDGIVTSSAQTTRERNRVEMIRNFEQAYELDKENPRLRLRLREELLRRVVDYQQAGDYAGSAVDLRKLIAWFPDDGELYYSLGVALYKTDATVNYAEAITDFKRAEALGYSDPKLYFAIGTVIYHHAITASLPDADRTPMIDEALEQYRRALGLNPNYADAWKGYGLAQMKAGRLEESRGSLEKALHLDPDNAEVYIYLVGLELEGFKNKAKALSYIDRALTLKLQPGQREQLVQLKANLERQ